MKILLEGAAGDGAAGGGGSVVGGAAGGQAVPPAWFAGLKDDALKGDATVTGTPDLETFVKRAIETKAMVGKKLSDFVPKPDWKPEQRAEWNKLVGVPEAPDKYTLPDEALLTKGGLTKEIVSDYLKHAHANHVPAETVKSTLDWYANLAAKGTEIEAQNKQAALDNDIKALKVEFGDKYDAKIGLVSAFLKKFGNEDLVKWANESGAGNNPGLVKSLVKAAESMLESSALGGNRDLGPDANRAAAMKEIDAIMAKRISDPAYAKSFSDPKSAEWQKWQELHQVAYPKVAA